MTVEMRTEVETEQRVDEMRTEVEMQHSYLPLPNAPRAGPDDIFIKTETTAVGAGSIY